MLKCIGLLLIFFFFSMGGHLFSRRERERILCLEGLIALVEHIRQGVRYERSPLNQLFASFFWQSLHDCGFLAVLNESGLSEAYQKNRFCFALNSFVENRFISFSETLGTLPQEEQVLACEACREALEKSMEEKKNAYPSRQKVYHAIGIGLGIGVVILLI